MSEAAVDAGNGSVSMYLPKLARIGSIDEVTSTEKTFRLEQEDGKPLGHRPGQFVQL